MPPSSRNKCSPDEYCIGVHGLPNTQSLLQLTTISSVPYGYRSGCKARQIRKMPISKRLARRFRTKKIVHSLIVGSRRGQDSGPHSEKKKEKTLLWTAVDESMVDYDYVI